MSVQNSGVAGVRNLRAMFENRASDQSTSPPSRGRSANSSEISGNSRPVSKVRTSFVAVERPGETGQASQWGLRKTSDVSSMASIKENGITKSESSQRSPESASVTDSSKTESSPLSPHMSRDPVEGGLGTILKGSSFADSGSPTKKTSTANKTVGTKEGLKTPSKTATKSTQDTSKPNAAVSTLPSRASPGRSNQVKPKSPTSNKSSPKTPTSPSASIQKHIKGGPAKIKAVMESANRAKDAREVTASQPPKQAAGNQMQNPTTQEEPKVNGVKKETITSPKTKIQPKSPTKPVKLPASATAPTAASSSRRGSQSQVQADAERRKSVTRRQSNLSLRQQKSQETSLNTKLAKKPSRASLVTGPEPSKSRASISGRPDESFLARMTRPTTSSASKIHEKVQITSPPRTNNSSTKQRDFPLCTIPPPQTDNTSAEGHDLENTGNDSTTNQGNSASPFDSTTQTKGQNDVQQDSSINETVVSESVNDNPKDTKIET